MFTHKQMAAIVDHSWAVITAKSAHGVACTSLRRLGHPARALDWVPRRIFVFSLGWAKKICCFLHFKRGVGGKPKDCSKTLSSVSNSAWESIFQMNVVAFYYLKIGFLEISGEIRYPNAPIGYWKKTTIWKEAVLWGQLSRIIRGRERAESVVLWWKDCPGDL